VCRQEVLSAFTGVYANDEFYRQHRVTARKGLAVRMTGGIVDGGGQAGEVRVVQPGDGVLQVDGYSLAQAGGQSQQAALGSSSALTAPGR
jgi:ribosomal protein L16/L10AE